MIYLYILRISNKDGNDNEGRIIRVDLEEVRRKNQVRRARYAKKGHYSIMGIKF
jgi:hypothetical protein